MSGRYENLRQFVAGRARQLGLNVSDALAWFDERAAIREYEGGMSRDEAEREAAKDVTEGRP